MPEDPDVVNVFVGPWPGGNLAASIGMRLTATSHDMPPVAQVSTGDDGDFVPAVPIDLAIAFENWIKPVPVERNVFPGMAEQLGKLAALEFKHPLRRPELAFHKHIENFLLQLAHKENSRTKRCCLPPAFRGISETFL